jgi:hypothetical protein
LTQTALSWLYNLEGWQITGLFILLFLIAVPILAAIFQFLWSKVPDRKKRNGTTVESVDEFWGLSRAADAFFNDLGKKLNSKRFAQSEPLYLVLTNDPEQFADQMKHSGLEARLKKAYSSGSVYWTSYLFGSLAVVSPKVWRNDSKYLEALIALLSRYRSERPLDGVIIDVSADALLEPRDEVIGKYKEIKQALSDIQAKSQMALPVYYVLSALDRVSGVDKVFNHNISRKSLLGVFAASKSAAFSSAERLGGALGELVEGVDAQALTALAESDLSQNDFSEIIEFPRQFNKIINTFIDLVEETFPFNSFEFAGELRSVAVMGSVTDPVTKQSKDLFCREFVEKVLLGEQNLAKPLPSALIAKSAATLRAKRRMWIVGAGCLVLLASQVVFINSILNKNMLSSKKVLASFLNDIENYEKVELGSNEHNKQISKNLASLVQYNPAGVRSFWAPVSLWSSTYSDMTKAQAALDEVYLFAPIHEALENRLNIFLRHSGSQRQEVTSDTPYPNFGFLKDSLNQTSKMEDVISTYKQIREGKYSRTQLSFLTSELLGFELHYSYYPALSGTQLYASLPLIPQTKLNQLPGHFESAADDFIFDLINRDAILNKSRRLALMLNGGQTELGSSRDALFAVREIQRLITELETLLLQGSYDWLTNAEMFESQEFINLLEGVESVNTLQQSTAQNLLKKLFSARKDLVSQMKRLRLPNGEPMFLFGKEQTDLNILLVETRQFLDQAMGLPLATESTFKYKSETDAQDLVLQLDALIGARLKTPELEALSDELARIHQLDFSLAPVKNVEEGLNKVLSDSALALMLEYAPSIRLKLLPQNFNTIENLFAISDEFNENFDLLRNISFYLDELGHPELSKIFDKITWTAASEIVDGIHSVLISDRAYGYDALAFKDWTGEKSLLHALLGPKDGDGLDLYLIKNAAFLEKLLIGKGEKSISYLNVQRKFESPTKVQQFNFVAASFEAIKGFVLEDPSSSVEKLHDFIKTELQYMNFGSCGLPQSSETQSPQDYFLIKIQTIKEFITTSCDNVLEENGEGAVAQFELMFEEKFLGKFPFSISPKAPGLRKTEVAELIDRFRVFERSGHLYWLKTKMRTSAHYTFFKNLEDTINFLEILSQTGDPEKPLKSEILVEFRTQRHAEELGKYVSLWQIEIDDRQLSHYSDRKIIEWYPESQIKIRLKWALDSLVRPKSGHFDGTFLRAVGDSVEVTITDNWSFLRLLKAYPTDQFCEADWHCIEINSPLDFISSSNNVLRGGQFKGFIDLKLLLGSQVSDIPDFPSSVPNVPGSKR